MLLADVHPPLPARRRSTVQGSYDGLLLLPAVLLAALGVVMVGSSSIAVAEGYGHPAFHYLYRHLVFLGLGIGGAWLIARTELEWLEHNSRRLLGLGVLLLLLVFLPGIGARINGAQRWLQFAGQRFQAVEATKLCLIIWLAGYLSRRTAQVRTSLRHVVVPLLVVLCIAALLLVQPDFGSATLLLGVVVGMVWLGGARVRDLLLPGLLTVPVLAYAALSENYRIKRLTSFLDPWADPFNDGFQLTQALIAIGRGEWFGVGLGASVQKLFYLPEAHTDFILAVLAEELGLAGIVLVLGLFAWLVGRGLMLGLRAAEQGQHFAAGCAWGVSLMLGMQALVSVGVNLGVLPTKGLTLPLISYGGSSVLMTSIGIGLLARCSYEVRRADNAVRQAIAERQFLGELRAGVRA